MACGNAKDELDDKSLVNITKEELKKEMSDGISRVAADIAKGRF